MPDIGDRSDMVPSKWGSLGTWGPSGTGQPVYLVNYPFMDFDPSLNGLNRLYRASLMRQNT
jgi:hypothetical protein